MRVEVTPWLRRAIGITPAVTFVLISGLAGASPAADQARPIDVTGRWIITYGVWRGMSPHMLDLRQDGATVTGRLTTSGGNTVRVEGRLSGDRLLLEFVYEDVPALAEVMPVEVARQVVGIRSRAELGAGADAEQLSGTLGVFSVAWAGTPPRVDRREDGRLGSSGWSQAAITMTRTVAPALVVPPAVPAERAPSVTASQSAGRIVEIATAREIAWGAPVDPTEVFDPGVNPIYVWFRHEGFAAGASVSSVWFYEGKTPPRRIAEASVALKPPSDWGQFNLELAAGKRWPAGNYRVELRIGDTIKTEVRFKVADAAVSEPAPAKPPSSYTHPRFGFTVMVPEGWSVDDTAPDSTVIKRADGNGLIEIRTGPTNAPIDPVSYAAGWESVSVGPGRRLVAKRGARRVTVDGESAYEAMYDGEGVAVRVVFLGKPDRFFVFTAVAPRDDSASVFELFDRLLASFAARGPR